MKQRASVNTLRRSRNGYQLPGHSLWVVASLNRNVEIIVKKTLLSLACGCSLAACGTTGIINPELATQPVPANQARVTITRDSSFLYMAAPADVSLDGHRLGQLGRGSSVIENIETGRHHLEVSTWSTPGNYNLSFEAAPGKNYAFTVGPRDGSYSSVSMGLVGDAIHAQVSENTGPFQIVPAAVPSRQ